MKSSWSRNCDFTKHHFPNLAEVCWGSEQTRKKTQTHSYETGHGFPSPLSHDASWVRESAFPRYGLVSPAGARYIKQNKQASRQKKKKTKTTTTTTTRRRRNEQKQQQTTGTKYPANQPTNQPKRKKEKTHKQINKKQSKTHAQKPQRSRLTTIFALRCQPVQWSTFVRLESILQ